MYTFLPFQFKRFEEYVLLVNEAGDFTYIDYENFDLFVHGKLDISSKEFQNLESKLFVTRETKAKVENSIAVRKLAARYRTRKSFLRDFTTLHMMVITLRCNQRCEYCQVSCADKDASKYDMSVEVAKKVVDTIFEAPTRTPKIEFQGGEPTLNWPVIEAVVEYAEQLALKINKHVDFVICTNLINITDKQLEFCKEHKISVSTSLDGPSDIHNACRITRNKQGTFDRFVERLETARKILGRDGVDALMTTTSYNLRRLKDVVDEYVRLGFCGIFIRSLNPYGYAAEQKDLLGYDMDEFCKNYIEVLKYIIELNKKVFFPEYFATLLFSRILTPFPTGFVDLQSPSGAGISGAIYDYDGSVYPADEARMLARMGDKHFLLGNVLTDSWESIFHGDKQKKLTADACVEVTVPCAWCAYQSFCGADPVRNYLETGSEIRNMQNSQFCIKHRTIFDYLFNLLKDADRVTMDIIYSWVNNNPDLVVRNERI